MSKKRAIYSLRKSINTLLDYRNEHFSVENPGLNRDKYDAISEIYDKIESAIYFYEQLGIDIFQKTDISKEVKVLEDHRHNILNGIVKAICFAVNAINNLLSDEKDKYATSVPFLSTTTNSKQIADDILDNIEWVNEFEGSFHSVSPSESI